MRPILIAALVALGFPVVDSTSFSEPPALRGDRGYVTNVETAIFNGTPSDVRAALQSPETGVLAYVETTDRIPAISEMTDLRGDFPDVDAVRKLTFEDGNTVVERVIENSETRFAYQVWEFTAANARVLNHIRGDFLYEPVSASETRVT